MFYLFHCAAFISWAFDLLFEYHLHFSYNNFLLLYFCIYSAHIKLSKFVVVVVVDVAAPR